MAVRASHLETAVSGGLNDQLLFFATRIENKGDFRGPKLDIRWFGATGDHIAPIYLLQGHQSQPTADFLLVLGMDIFRIANINTHRHAGVGHGFRHPFLGGTEGGPCSFQEGLCFGIVVVGELHEQKRNGTLSPRLPPSRDQL